MLKLKLVPLTDEEMQAERRERVEKKMNDILKTVNYSALRIAIITILALCVSNYSDKEKLSIIKDLASDCLKVLGE